ncbi:MAG: hypothetical protein OHK0013_09110 [Sandaracinaceae bacterium]
MPACSELDLRCVVYRDAHVLVADKPAGMLSVEREAGGRDALASRLGIALGLARPLAVISRLDQDTSGLVVFPLSDDARVSLARQSEARAIEKRYVAAVSLRAGARMPSGRLEDVLVERDGHVEVRPGAKDGKRAASEAKLLARHGRRALVEVRLETGRTHQIRVQLAHRGAPIGGDVRYGGELAPRLLLACTTLAFEHPERGAMRFERPLPPIFEAWARGTLTPADALEVALEAAIERRHDLLRGARDDGPEATTAFRLFSEAGDGVPGLALDVYGEHLVAHLHDVAIEEDALLDRVAARCLAPLGLRGLYVKRRPRKAQDLSAKDLEAYAPTAPVRGESALEEIVVRERGMPFLVRLGDGMSTGLFLDQRLNRARVRERARGRRMLNLFAYTCGFTVAAALGGAASTTSVDASRKALDRGRANLALSGLDGPAHRFIADDALALLPRLAKRGERFDLVCVDPPTFSTTRSSRWTSGRDWEALAEKVFAVVAEGGTVLATSNDRRMTQGAFRAFVRRGAERAGVRLARLVDLGQPLDFRDGPGENPLLKGVLAELG